MKSHSLAVGSTIELTQLITIPARFECVGFRVASTAAIDDWTAVGTGPLQVIEFVLVVLVARVYNTSKWCVVLVRCDKIRQINAKFTCVLAKVSLTVAQCMLLTNLCRFSLPPPALAA